MFEDLVVKFIGFVFDVWEWEIKFGRGSLRVTRSILRHLGLALGSSSRWFQNGVSKEATVGGVGVVRRRSVYGKWRDELATF